MIRGSTPRHYFESPCDVETINKVNFIYKQDDELILKKKTEDVTIEDNVISIQLTREESLKFSDDKSAKVQAVILTRDGKVLISTVKSFGVGELLDDGEIE